MLRTKLYRPRVSADLVHRPRLKELLDGGLSRSLILVAAPAGFGKTTLLSAGLDTCHHPSAWVVYRFRLKMCAVLAPCESSAVPA